MSLTHSPHCQSLSLEAGKSEGMSQARGAQRDMTTRGGEEAGWEPGTGEGHRGQAKAMGMSRGPSS